MAWLAWQYAHTTGRDPNTGQLAIASIEAAIGAAGGCREDFDRILQIEVIYKEITNGG